MQRLEWPVDHLAAALITPDAVETQGDQDQVFPLASVSKLLSAYGFLIAVEEGVFDLDSTYEIPDSPFEAVSIRQLLSHASGVGMRAGDRLRAPEQRRIYSSYGFELLADILHTESGITFPEYLREAVFEPLGMSQTVLHGSAGHGISSTAGELTSFIQELKKPTLISTKTLQEAFSIQYPDLIGVVPGYGMQKPNPWGLGFEIHGTKSPHWLPRTMPPEVVGHFGMSGTFLWFAATQGVGMVALTDRPFGQWAQSLWASANSAIWDYVTVQVGVVDQG